MLIAIGDLHGHYPALQELLATLENTQRVFVPGGRGRLRPGVKLVFTGDYIDRGPRGLAIIARLAELQEANPGRVVTLLGNHELMALEAYDDAVDIWRGLAGASPRRAIGAYEATSTHGFNGGSEFIREFESSKKDVLESYVTRMAAAGDIGAWMRSLRPAHKAKVAGRTVLFMHGDLPEDLRDARTLDRYIRFIDTRRRLPSEALGGTRTKWGHPWLEKFFWNRSFRDLAGASPRDVSALCRSAGVDYIVTGHTPHRDITVYGRRIFDIDVGMTPACGGGRPQALVLDTSGIWSVSADGTTRVFVRFSRSRPSGQES